MALEIVEEGGNTSQTSRSVSREPADGR
jgi:hypothetical protein